MKRLALLLLLGIFAVQAGAVPSPDKAVGERTRAGAQSTPGAAWHHLALARTAADQGHTAKAIANYRLATDLDPNLLGAWIGMVEEGFPADFHLVLEGASGAIRTVGRSWETQRRLVAAVVPTFLVATFIAAALLLAGIALRHLPRKRHILLEAFRPHLGRWSAGSVASILCLVPLGVQWGLAATAATYAGLVRADLGRRESRLAILAILWLIVMPAIWKVSSPRVAPIDPKGYAWLIERTQREVPTPALEQTIREVAEEEPTAEIAFAEGLLHRRAGRLPNATGSFKRALGAGKPIDAHALVNLGNLRLWRGDSPGAAQYYEQVLDDPQACLEARYNLAIALSRLHRFEEADERYEEAAKLDFDRVRTAVRTGGRSLDDDVMDGMLAASELWRIEAPVSTEAASIPPILAWFLPGGRLIAAPLAILGGLFIGSVIGAVLSRRLRVHECQHCGTPVCRRCVTRAGGHAYCVQCASTLGTLPRAAYNRVLLRRLLGKELVRGERIKEWVTNLTPGIGPVIRGRTLTGLFTSWLFVLGCLFATRAVWPFPESTTIEGIGGLLGLVGVFLAAIAWIVSFFSARRVRPRHGVRHHFEKDIYRLAA